MEEKNVAYEEKSDRRRAVWCFAADYWYFDAGSLYPANYYWWCEYRPSSLGTGTRCVGRHLHDAGYRTADRGYHHSVRIESGQAQ